MSLSIFILNLQVSFTRPKLVLLPQSAETISQKEITMGKSAKKHITEKYHFTLNSYLSAHKSTSIYIIWLRHSSPQTRANLPHKKSFPLGNLSSFDPNFSLLLPFPIPSLSSKRNKAPSLFRVSRLVVKWRRPTLPRVCSTIGAVGLNFSVRNGKRWNPVAITTGNIS